MDHERKPPLSDKSETPMFPIDISKKAVSALTVLVIMAGAFMSYALFGRDATDALAATQRLDIALAVHIEKSDKRIDLIERCITELQTQVKAKEASEGARVAARARFDAEILREIRRIQVR